MRLAGVASAPSLIARNWVWLLLGTLVAIYAAKIVTTVVPGAVRLVVPLVVRTVTGH